jgi:hypothetical protein
MIAILVNSKIFLSHGPAFGVAINAAGLIAFLFGIYMASRFWPGEFHSLWERDPRFLISIVYLVTGLGLVVLGMVLTITSGTDTARVDDSAASRLTTLLEERLPSADVLERRHRELLDAVRSSQSREPITPVAPSPMRILGYGFLVIGAAVCAFAVLWPFRDGGKLNVGRKIRVGTLGVGTLLSLGGVTLVQHAEFKFVRQNIDGGRPSPGQAVTMARLGSVGPFVSGTHTMLDPDGQSSMNAVKQSITDSQAHGKLLILFVVGSADKRPLSGRVAAIYGSNEGLAGARADWVRCQIVSLPSASFPANRVVVTIRGPAKIGASVSSLDMSSDRLVDVYGLWTETQVASARTQP